MSFFDLFRNDQQQQHQQTFFEENQQSFPQFSDHLFLISQVSPNSFLEQSIEKLNDAIDNDNESQMIEEEVEQAKQEDLKEEDDSKSSDPEQISLSRNIDESTDEIGTEFLKWDKQPKESESSLGCSTQQYVKRIGNSRQESCSLVVPAATQSKKRKLFEVIAIPRNSMTQKQVFYVFADQLINLQYLRSVSNHTEDDYLRESDGQSQFNGMKFIHRIEHKIDTKAIEFSFELTEQYLQDITPVISMLNSIGDATLFEFANRIKQFWIDISQFKQMIVNIGLQDEFILHREARLARSQHEMNELIKNIDPTKIIQYTKYKVNYANGGYDSSFTGYTPPLYELIAGNSYAFTELLSKNGYHDAVYSKNRLDWCLQAASKFFNDQANNLHPGSKVELAPMESSIVTADCFSFPISLKTTVHNIDYAYDQENGLKYVVNDILAIYEFTIHDESIVKELQNIRRGSKYGQIVNSPDFTSENELRMTLDKKYDPKFFEKYYKDDLQTLLKRGNKWNKVCGVVDVPTKKFQAITQNPFTS